MYYLAHAETAFKLVKSDGTVVALTLPSGVTVSDTHRARSAILGSFVAIVNAPSENLLLDSNDNTVRRMSLLPPTAAPDAAAGAGTGLTGVYRYWVSFAVKNADGDVINESPLSPRSAALTLTNQNVSLTNIPVSLASDCNCRRIYRTAAGGTLAFQCYDIDDNVSTTLTDAIDDDSLSRLPSDPKLGNPAGALPGERLTLICVWKSRLWAVPIRYDLRDDVIFSEADRPYAWPASNLFPAYPIGEDTIGVTGFLPRRDALGVLKRGRVLKIVGSSTDDFEMLIVVENTGCIAPESCIVVRDVGYWLGPDGVYSWDDAGVRCISRKNVDPWFTSDTYFNRTYFAQAIGGYNPVTNCYELGLMSAGSTERDVWVSYAIEKDEWLGPHSTSAFVPQCRALLVSDEEALRPAMGGQDGYVYLENGSNLYDLSGAGAQDGISWLLRTKWHHQGNPNATHFWGQLHVLNRAETASSLRAQPYVGGLSAAAQSHITVDLTKELSRHRRLGVGRLCSLQFEQDAPGNRALLYGYSIRPIFEVGIRGAISQ